MMNLFLAFSFIKYRFRARYRKGYGLHSPFVFHLVREILNCDMPFYAFNKINAYRKKLLVSKKILEVRDLGSGSRYFESASRKVSDVARHTAVEKKYGEVLFRLVNEYKPQTILELGTSMGVSTLYLSMPDTSAEVYTIEGCSNTAEMAQQIFKEYNCRGVHSIVGNFDEALPEVVHQLEQLDFVYFDGNHQKEATLDYFNRCLTKATNDSVFVFDDIHWSKGMEEAWEEICRHPDISVSMDLFRLGICFFRKECQKQHFVVKF